jgi:hypothetical protein
VLRKMAPEKEQLLAPEKEQELLLGAGSGVG